MNRFFHSLKVVDQWVARREFRVMALLLLFLTITLGYGALLRPLGHDEIFTRLIGGLPGLRAVTTALLGGADAHPPLDFLLRHVFLQLHQGPLVFRLPSLLAFLGWLVCLYRMGGKYFGQGGGILAAAVGVQGYALGHSIDARAYMPGLFLLTASLHCWMEWESGHQWLRGAAMTIAFAASILLHYYMPFWFLAIVLAEVVWLSRHRRIRWGIWTSFAGTLAGIFLCLPYIRGAASYSKAFWTPTGMNDMWLAYGQLVRNSLPLLLLLLLWLFLGKALSSAASHCQLQHGELQLPDGFRSAMCYLLLLPVFTLALSRFTHAFSARYAAGAVVAIVFAIIFLIRGLHAPFVTIALLCALLMAGFKLQSDRGFARAAKQETAALEVLLRANPDPIVVETSNTFLEARDRLPPELRDRIMYIGDVAAAQKYLNNDTGPRALLGLSRFVPLPVYLIDKLKTMSRVRVYHEGGWLLPWCQQHGCRMGILTVQPFMFDLTLPAPDAQ